jgi:hypothetical protein
MGNLRKWSVTASGNASIAGGASTINFSEGQAPSSVNNSARETLAQIRAQYRNDQWIWVEHSGTASVASQTVFKISGDQTGAYVANRKVRIHGGSATVYAEVLSASFTAETAVTIQNASGSLSSSMSVAALSAAMSEALPATSTFLTSGSASAMIASALSTAAYITSNSASTGYEALGKLKGINHQTGTTYDFVLADAGKLCEFSNAASTLVRLPTSASIAFPVATRIDVIQTGAGTVSFTAGAGETLTSFNSAKQLAGRYAGGTFVKVANNTWRFVGNIT